MMCFPPPLYQHKPGKNSFVQGVVMEKVSPDPAWRPACGLQKHQLVAALQSCSWGNRCSPKAPKRTPVNNAIVSIISSVPLSYFSSGSSLQNCVRTPLLAQPGVYFTGWAVAIMQYTQYTFWQHKEPLTAAYKPSLRPWLTIQPCPNSPFCGTTPGLLTV